MNALSSRWRAGLVVLALGFAVAMVGAFVPITHAAFTASTASTANQLQTATLAPATGFQAECVSETEVQLTWTPSTTGAVTGYHLERRREDEVDYTSLATVTSGTAASYSDTDSPFPSGILEVAATVNVEYRIYAEIAGTSWRSPAAEATTSGTVTTVFLVTSFTCD